MSAEIIAYLFRICSGFRCQRINDHLRKPAYLIHLFIFPPELVDLKYRRIRIQDHFSFQQIFDQQQHAMVNTDIGLFGETEAIPVDQFRHFFIPGFD